MMNDGEGINEFGNNDSVWNDSLWSVRRSAMIDSVT
jgi:hypothetical protein